VEGIGVLLIDDFPPANRPGSGKMNWIYGPVRISRRLRTGAYHGGSRLASAVPEFSRKFSVFGYEEGCV
jgi:hypothetical protein